MSEHSWPQVIAAAMAGADAHDIAWAMNRILEDEVTPAQLAALLTAVRMRGETPEQLQAMLDAMLAHATVVDRSLRPDVVVDVVGTGGDGSNSVNISTMAAAVVAACGAPVMKHGNRAASSATGSADVLAALGVAIELNAQAVAECVTECGIAFCFAPTFHPALRFAGPTRRELGVPTVFNILGPLANPAGPEAMLIGCAREESAPVMAEVLTRRGVKALVVRGHEGLDEISIGGLTRIWDATSDRVVESDVDPREWGIPFTDIRMLEGSTPQVNLELLVATLNPDAPLGASALGASDGINEAKISAIRNSVAVNAAAALVTYDAAIGEASEAHIADRIAHRLPDAQRALESGSAWSVMKRWVEVSQQFS